MGMVLDGNADGNGSLNPTFGKTRLRWSDPVHAATVELFWDSHQIASSILLFTDDYVESESFFEQRVVVASYVRSWISEPVHSEEKMNVKY